WFDGAGPAGGRSSSMAKDVCVSASSSSAGSRKRTPRARSSGVGFLGTLPDLGSCARRSVVPGLLDLDDLAAGVVAAVAADAMRQLRLVALWAVRVGRRGGLPARGAHAPLRLRLLALWRGHGSLLRSVVSRSGA